ncbi:FRIGIDA-like protein 4a isoform X1 [Vitis riparia]|uniref:FRIGIDA-like protein 4a isoform X2 n=1 Tax=Vitis vinifera TaxID=29760 RepID=UPI0005402B20|nr:FRIGIDA-like protein 4a isoform X2 [Vitis vinifera]XP_034699995.1 FRIGIDA-like protein 4a isoform X1 [Vitis riparia]|eukprot:XP_010656337.1 PREDICTED: FRIGIDA-like protein 4a isoform X1 [Vitis vinifera]
MAIDTDRVQKLFDSLEAQKTILSTCTQLYKTLSNHFSSLQHSLSQKSSSLDSKFQALESDSKKTLESLDQRENSIPERESSAAARIEEQREAALSEFEKAVPENAELSECLKSYCRKMDSSGLLRFMVSKRKESMSLRSEIVSAMEESVDSARLVLDAVEEFVSQKSGKVGIPDKRWACGMLMQALFPAAELGGKTVPKPAFARSVVERAARVAELWKGKMGDGGEGSMIGPTEAAMFMQMVAGFGLKPKFDEEFLRKQVLEFASRRDMPKLAIALGFGEKMGGTCVFTDIIDELVKSGKEIEAVYFASESGLTERFSPVSLLKSYLHNSRKNATTILKNGNYSTAATEESGNVELNSIKTIIKCVEDHKLESEFSIDSLRKRATQLEKAKVERKKSSAGASKPPNKRAHGGGSGSGSGRGSGPSAFRPAKAPKFSNSTYPSFGRRNPAPPPQHSPAGRYSGPFSYPAQGVYDGPTPPPYASTYGGPHPQTPTIPQQHYSLSVDDMGAGGMRASGSYGGQTSYNAYDYAAAAPPTYHTQ